MSEAAPEAEPAQESTEQPAEPVDLSAEVERLKTELAKASKWEQRSKENHAKLQEYEREKLPAAERAVAEAEQRGRTTALQEVGQRLAKSEIRAAAADAGADLGGVFDYLDLGRFVGEDGEPDAKAIKAFVGALPKRVPEGGSLDLGQRGTPPAGQDMNQLLRRATGRA